MEELARQMKEEKDHLRLEADEIERERNAMLTREPDTKSVVSIQNFVRPLRNTYFEFKKAD